MNRIICKSVFLTAVVALSIQAQSVVTLLPGSANALDACWVPRSFGGQTMTTYGINGTGSSLNGYVTWSSFSGITGRYKVELRAVLESDGNSPYKLYVAGAEVRSGNYPYADGTLNCNGTTYTETYLQLGEHQISQGAQIRYWAQSVYPCGSAHGQYSRFQQIRFTPVSTTTDNTAPSAPTNVRSVSTTNTSITIAWNASSDAQSGISGYNVYVGTTRKMNVDGPVLQATLTGLSRNTEYQNISVSAVNGVQLESAKSAAINVRTANESAPAGTMFIRAADGVLSNGMALAYSANGALGVNAMYGTVGNGTSPASTDSKATYTFTVATAGTIFAWFRARYFNDNANSWWVSVDGGAAQRAVNGTVPESWHWEGYMGDGAVNLGVLAAGEHTLTITVREAAAQSLLDVICLTTSNTYIPTDADVDFMALKPITILSPVGGESYAAGATMNIRWATIQSRVPEVLIQLSVNGGEDFTTISGAGSISTTSPNWGNFAYVIPANQVSNQCYVRVVNYNEQSMYETSPRALTITQSSTVTQRAGLNSCAANPVQAYRGRSGLLELRLSREGVYDIQVLDLRGSILARCSETGPRSITMPELVAPGVLVVRATVPGADAPVVLRVTR